MLSHPALWLFYFLLFFAMFQVSQIMAMSISRVFDSVL